jgi:putative protease
MNKMKKELLAPVGSYEAFRACLNAGADAFYLGADRFGARAYAENFAADELLRVIDEAHLFGRKVYLTANTLIKENEMRPLFNMLVSLYEHGLDAVIVQDTGVLKLIRELMPDLPVHASTQMTVTGADGAAFLEKQGVARVIPARELSLDEIKKIRSETSLEIECFVHGALCYCYSGACLMSSFIGGRSGNRGRCAQPCRLPYKVFKDGRCLTEGSEYVMNTKDICLVEHIAELVDAGIDSFKIEGRMKRAEYAAGVVSVYRKYLDLYEEGRIERVAKKDAELLDSLFNRDGFSSGYFFAGGRPEMIAAKNVRLSGKRASAAENAYSYVRENIIERPLKKVLNAEFVIDDEYSARLTVFDEDGNSASVCQKAQKAQSRPVLKEDILKQINKTGDTYYTFASIDVSIPENAFMSVGQIKEMRRAALSAFGEKIASAYRRSMKVKEAREHASGSEARGFFADGKKAGELWASVADKRQFGLLNKNSEIAGFYIPYDIYMEEFTEAERNANAERIFIALPYISRHDKNADLRKNILKLAKAGCRFLVRNLEDAGLLIENGYAGSIRTDYTLYTMNPESIGFWRGNGVIQDTAPLELDSGELATRDNSESEIIIYGRIPLMVSAQCVVKNFAKCSPDKKSVYLTDRTNAVFPVERDCENCYNLIYNSVPLSLISEASFLGRRLRFARYRLSFTVESDGEISKIVKDAVGALVGAEYKEEFKFTRGHFRRPVE